MRPSLRKPKVDKIRLLLLASYLLLLVFSGHWLYTQYLQEKTSLKQDLVQLFDRVQQDITDSLLMIAVIQPSLLSVPTVNDDTQLLNLDKDSIHKISSLLFQESHNDLSLRGLKLAVRKVKQLTPAERLLLFRIDTTAFNKDYIEEIRRRGWHFTVRWIPADDKAIDDKQAIFIPNRYFQAEHGVAITHYTSYLLGKLWPQATFIAVLLTVTLLALRTTYHSLLRQIELNTLKDDLVSNISHELKTPIATVKVAVEAIQHFDHTGQDELRADYLQMAALELERLELLVNRTLHTSLVESGRLSLQKEWCDVHQLVEEVLAAYQVRFQAYDAQVRFLKTGDTFSAEVDRLHMQGVLINLLDNSLKYNKAKADIIIQLKTSTEGTMHLSVTDNGPGIPDNYLNKVFDKFFRVPTGNKHEVKGYGLGLNYAAQVMRQHNGNIEVHNMPQGGCTFTLAW